MHVDQREHKIQKLENIISYLSNTDIFDLFRGALSLFRGKHISVIHCQVTSVDWCLFVF